MRKGASFRGAVLALIAVTVAAEARSSWKIDPSQTHVRFWVDAIGWPRTNGEFKSFDGPIEIDFDRPSRSRVDFRVAARSVDANSASLNEYLRSEASRLQARRRSAGAQCAADAHGKEFNLN